MTREEAIKFLNEQKEFLLKGCFWEETRMNINEAFDMAIEALEADVPDTNVGDTISRQAAIDALGEEPEVWTGKDEYAQGLNNQWHYDINALKAVPSAQPVIRCKDCKHFGGGTYCYERDDMWCEDDFCSYAERKEQDDG